MTNHIEDGVREAMRESFERFGRDRCTEAFVRRQMETPDGHDRRLWGDLAALGFTALLVPEAFGGLGGGAREAETIMEEAGKILLPGPLFSSAILATALIAHAPDPRARERLLPRLADGSLIATAALTGKAGRWDGQVIEIEIDADGRLEGTAHFVSDAQVADIYLVVAGRGEKRRLFEVDRQLGRIEIVRTFDRTQRLARVHFDHASATPIEGAGAEIIDAALALAKVALLGRQVGAMTRNFEFTIDYLRTRVQFGRPIGGFQALKHMAADLLVELESARTAARHAADCLAEDRPDAAEAIAMAGFLVSDAQARIAAEAIQLHGGIGFTWEHAAHLYLRRAHHDGLFLGSPESQREAFLSFLEEAA